MARPFLRSYRAEQASRAALRFNYAVNPLQTTQTPEMVCHKAPKEQDCKVLLRCTTWCSGVGVLGSIQVQISAHWVVCQSPYGGHQRNHLCLVSSVARADRFTWTLQSGVRTTEHLLAGVAVLHDDELR